MPSCKHCVCFLSCAFMCIRYMFVFVHSITLLLTLVCADFISSQFHCCTFIPLQSTWHISPVRSKRCIYYSELSRTWFSSAWGTGGWQPYLWTLFSCFYEPQHEVWRCRSSVSLQFLILIMRYLKKRCFFLFFVLNQEGGGSFKYTDQLWALFT